MVHVRTEGRTHHRTHGRTERETDGLTNDGSIHQARTKMVARKAAISTKNANPTQIEYFSWHSFRCGVRFWVGVKCAIFQAINALKYAFFPDRNRSRDRRVGRPAGRRCGPFSKPKLRSNMNFLGAGRPAGRRFGPSSKPKLRPNMIFLGADRPAGRSPFWTIFKA